MSIWFYLLLKLFKRLAFLHPINFITEFVKQDLGQNSIITYVVMWTKVSFKIIKGLG